ncbi:hypothetical protein Hanom_Chr16g01484491 [Helianthus anomalus]
MSKKYASSSIYTTHVIFKKRSFDSRINFTISSYTIYFSLLSFHIRKGLHISHTRFSILV